VVPVQFCSKSVVNFYLSAFSTETTVGKDKFIIGVTYRPPNQDVQLFNMAFEKLLDKLTNCNGHKILLTGDFNINLLNYETHHDTGEFLNNIILHHQYPTILQPDFVLQIQLYLTTYSPTT